MKTSPLSLEGPADPVKIKITVDVSSLELYFSKLACQMERFLNTLGLISCVHLGKSP